MSNIPHGFAVQSVDPRKSPDVKDYWNYGDPFETYPIDCGFHINPERIRSQIEGAAVMGLALAKNSAITFKGGRAQQKNFDTFVVARIDEAPLKVHVDIIPATWNVPSSGVGEPGLPPFAPALCNAIFIATGKRIRSLPIGQQLSI